MIRPFRRSVAGGPFVLRSWRGSPRSRLSLSRSLERQVPRGRPPPPAQPTSADQIQNVDQVKTAIKAYYGDTIDSTRVNPVDPSVPLHTFSPSGAYANELAGFVDAPRSTSGKPNNGDHPSSGAAKAVLLTSTTPAQHLQLRHLHQLRLQPDFERRPSSTRPSSTPCRTWSTSSTTPSRRATRSSS